MAIEKKLSPHEKELRDSLKKIAQYMPRREESRYFVQQAYQFFSMQGMKGKNPGVILLGTSFPEEILYAFGLAPFWVLGGSFALKTGREDAPTTSFNVCRFFCTRRFDSFIFCLQMPSQCHVGFEWNEQHGTAYG